MVQSILEELWLHALPWEGQYRDQFGAIYGLEIIENGVVRCQEGSRELLGSVQRGQLDAWQGACH